MIGNYENVSAYYLDLIVRFMNLYYYDMSNCISTRRKTVSRKTDGWIENVKKEEDKTQRLVCTKQLSRIMVILSKTSSGI